MTICERTTDNGMYAVVSIVAIGTRRITVAANA
jgi:hypothetical protein